MLLGLFLVAVLLCTPTHSNWWNTGNQVITDPEVVCRRAKRLRGRMANICRGEPALLKSIKSGVDLGMKQCQFQFQNRHWNCTAEKKSIRKVLLRDSRETGFVNAVTAAGVTYSVTQACSLGNIVDCSCDKTGNKGSNRHSRRQRLLMGPREGGEWKWGGCGDNVVYGYKKSKAFMDYPYRRRSDMRTLIRVHNNDAGRLAVKNHMKTDCKCHGLSGSCYFRTCWKRMPSFSEIGNRLKESFDGATKVIPSNDGRHFFPEGSRVKPPLKSDIVYSENAGDFCKYNRSNGSLGTHGRECNATSPGDGGCDILCCRRGFDTKVVRETVNCRCRFKWCCEVECSTCRQKRTVHTCR